MADNSNNYNNNNNNNNSNNINNDSTVKLNPFIFNDVLPYMLYSCKFQRLLDLSLISKSAFKLVQFNVTFKQNQIKFYPYDDQLLEYIKKSVKSGGSDSESDGNSDSSIINGDDQLNFHSNELLGGASEIREENEDISSGSENSDQNEIGSESEEYSGSENGEYSTSENEEYSASENEEYSGSDNEEYSGSDNENSEEKEDIDSDGENSDENEDIDSDKIEFGGSENSEENEGNGSSDEINKNDTSVSIFKLFQFSRLSVIYLKQYSTFSFEDLKSQLIRYCGSRLKKIQFVSYIYIDTMDSNVNCDGFYQFNKVYTHWDLENPPISTEGEQVSFHNPVNNEFYQFVKFSFEYLGRIKPKKLKFSTAASDMELHLYHLNNILKCKSLESIKFGYHDTYNDKFIVRALSSKSPQLKELTIRPYPSKSINSVARALAKSNNNTLRKLVIRDQVEYTGVYKDPKKFLDQLVGNTSIQVLGLEVYKIKESNYKSLSTLLQIPNIQEIRCDLSSAIPFLLHCMENPNIKVLQIKNNQYDTSDSKFDDDQDDDEYQKLLPKITKCFSKLITQNQSLEIIKITACYDLYDRLIEILNKSNNNNNNNNHNFNLQIKRIIDKRYIF